jgi:ABC-type antimicrobial peptide transport system permease subunit
MTSPGFFETLGAPLVRGRDFDEHDRKGGPRVAIINEALARRYFAGRDPLGQTLTEVGPFNEPFQIIGIAPDMKLRSLRETPRPSVYVALAQSYTSNLAMLVRTSRSPSAVIPALQDAVAKLDKDLPLYGIASLEDRLGAALEQERAMAILLSAFGLLAVVLAATGLGALVFHQAQSRSREFGVRLVLGARPQAVVNLVMMRGARLSGMGAALGLLGSLLLAPMVESFLFEVRPQDPITFLVVTLTLGLVSLAAAFLPSWKASRTDPAVVLRSE